MRTRLVSIPLLLTALVVAPACSGEDPPGSLIVPFTIGADVECSVLGVTEVTVDLYTASASGAAGELVDSATVACEEGEAEFMGLPVGRYEVRATGVDVENVIVADNLDKDPADTAEVTSGALNTANSAVMYPTPAKVHVRWQFNGGFSMCSGVPVAEVRVVASEKGGLSPLINHVFDCDPKDGVVAGYNVIPDPMRDIAGDDLNHITIDPLDDKGTDITPSPLVFKFDAPGHGRTVKLTALIDCDEDDKCTISCAPDKNPDPMKPLECLVD